MMKLYHTYIENQNIECCSAFLHVIHKPWVSVLFHHQFSGVNEGMTVRNGEPRPLASATKLFHSHFQVLTFQFQLYVRPFRNMQ